MNRDPYAPPRTAPKGLGPAVAVSLLLLGVLAIIGLWSVLRFVASPLHDPDAQPAVVEARGELAADERTTIEIFRRSSPSVVNIATSAVRRNLWSRNPVNIPVGTGSGFLWGDEGYVVTNFHVIAGGSDWVVTLADMSHHGARVVGYSADHDLAVLKIDVPARRLRPLRVGRSEDLQVGQKVFAIGNPFGGLDHTLTTGVISGLRRRIVGYSGEVIEDVIQTDAAINPGNSGGPLLDSAGLLIGVNVSITEEGQNIGFAIPVDTVNRVVPRIIRGGAAEASPATGSRAGLGVLIAPQSFVQKLGIEGAVVERVVPGSAAERAGLRPVLRREDGGYLLDVITGLDGRAVRSRQDLLEALEDREPGDRVALRFRRDGEELEVELALDDLSRL